MSDRFKLEDQIMDCWGVTGDIQNLINGFEGLNEDERMNILIGLRSLYHVKFVQLFDTFEELLRTHDITPRRTSQPNTQS